MESSCAGRLAEVGLRGTAMHVLGVVIEGDRYPTRQCYPFNISVLGERTELTFQHPIVFFVGENGSGKSTLLQAITRRCGIPVWDKPKRHLAHRNPYEGRLVDYVLWPWASTRRSARFSSSLL